MIIDMACPNESNKEEKRLKNIRKYQQLCFELRERRIGFPLYIIGGASSNRMLRRRNENVKKRC